MIYFFRTPSQSVIATSVDHELSADEKSALCWLYGGAKEESEECLKGFFVGPRREMITPWSTNAVEITQNMSLTGVKRIEEYFAVESEDAEYDTMLQRMYKGLNQDIFTVNIEPAPILHIDNLEEYNEQEGLALSPEEIEYLHKVEDQLGRKLTDSEVFGFAQINSEHCRHKIFGGTFIIDGVEKESSLFQMIKKTTQENPNKIISAYKDNVAFAQGPVVEQFSPKDHSTSDYFEIKDIESVISLKAETHNFPTTVEPFNGASTGTGGEIRDRMGGGVGSWPIAGTAVYMTSYPEAPLQLPPAGGESVDAVISKYRTADPLLYDVLKENAKNHRNNPTEAEAILWEALRNKSLGFKFRRQHAIADFIVDFVCLANGLVVEVDGGYHNTDEQQRAEELRTLILQDLGYHVIRFTNEEVVSNIDAVVSAIKEDIDSTLTSNSSPTGGGREGALPPRKWLYQTPEQILIKASNGASDFGNKFGQPLITGSVLTFEHSENGEDYGYDKVIMLAGGVGYGTKRDCLKGTPQKGNKVVVVGGDNYRIGLGGGSVSSVDTGRYSSGIELNAVQRANPEMQKRANNLVRALCEEDVNPVVSIHDHGSAGHVNCLSELVEECGGTIDMTKLPIGDQTLSSKEIIANESQERMGLLIQEEHIDHVRKIAERERAPLYVVGECTGDAHFAFEQGDGVRPFDLEVSQMFGHSPKTYMKDETVVRNYENATYSYNDIETYLENVLQLEAVACKDWLTNKVDRSVTGKVARQQCQGEIQLPLSDCGVVALDYRGEKGIATAIGHAPQAGLADPAAGSVLSVAESLTNLVWAPLAEGLDSVSLSANWMWPCRSQKGEDARLYAGVEALSDFCCSLQINVPTGKDSLSMTQKYGDGSKVISPGTVIVSSGGEVSDVKKVVSPVLVNNEKSAIYHIDFSFDTMKLGGSAFAQTLGKVGSDVPTVQNPEYFRDAFLAVQELVNKELLLAGHDISAGGLITCLLEMCFANAKGGIEANLKGIAESDIVKVLFAENPGVVVQVANENKEEVEAVLNKAGIAFVEIGKSCAERTLTVKKDGRTRTFDIDKMRDVWYETSHRLDQKQSFHGMADERAKNYKLQPLEHIFPAAFTGKLAQYGISADRRERTGIKAAIIREKGTNGEREMAYSLYLAGFDVKDVMMTDLVSGRETLEDINMIVFCGGFSNSDVLGSAKGWAGAFLYNPKAKAALDAFYARKDTLSLGICNGCQLMMELNLINPEYAERGKMEHNISHKFESEFVTLQIPENKSVMFGTLSGSKLGIWVAHGEGRFSLPYAEEKYNVVAKYNYSGYPANPNGSDYDVAGLASADGRHLAMMPHLERAIFPWQQANYPAERKADEVTPWIEAFVNARKWVEANK